MKVLDASGIINARDRGVGGGFIAPPEIESELTDIQARLKFEAAVSGGRIKLESPSKKAIEAVKKVAEKYGTLALLSLADLMVLALAYERKLPVVTDDYDIQNMCLLMGAKFETVTRPGIRSPYAWKKRCTACGKEYCQEVSECEACGSESFKISPEKA